jgi:hypothetical protein
VSWRWRKAGLWCWLASAGILGATVLPQGNTRLPNASGVLTRESSLEAWQLYYTAWGPASVVRPDPARPAAATGSSQDSDDWRWEEASLYHFTKPPVEASIVHSRVGRRLLELYETGLNLLPLEAQLRVYASFTGAGYDLNAWRQVSGAELETAEVNLVPEPSPLALLLTGLVCIALAKGLRRRRAG